MGYRNAPDEPGRPSWGAIEAPRCSRARRLFGSLRGGESGQSLVLIVMSMTLIVLVAAFAIDASEWFAKHHQAQVSADASALAAANCLATQKCTSTVSGGDAYTTATNYAATDGVPASSVTFGGGYVTVTTATPAPISFAGSLGIHPTAQARAVASYDVATPAADLFAQDCSNPRLLQPITSSTCTVSCASPGISVATNGTGGITGAIQTNGSLSINEGGSGSVTLGDMLYGDPATGGPNCHDQTYANYSPGGAVLQYGPPQEEPAFAAFPDTYNSAVATSNCTAPSTYYGTNASGATTSGTVGNSTTYTGSGNISIPSGTTISGKVVQGVVTIQGSFGSASSPATICAWGFNVPNNINSATLTAVTLSALGSAPSVSILGNKFAMTPNPNNTPDTGQKGPALAIYDAATICTKPSDGLDLSKTNNDNIAGAVYVPASCITMGGNNTGVSFWEANTISFQGNNAAGGPTETLPGLGIDQLVQ